MSVAGVGITAGVIALLLAGRVLRRRARAASPASHA